MRAQDADALLWLIEAERLAPEWIRGGRVEVHDMVGAMLRRERGRRPGLRELAGRVRAVGGRVVGPHSLESAIGGS